MGLNQQLQQSGKLRSVGCTEHREEVLGLFEPFAANEPEEPLALLGDVDPGGPSICRVRIAAHQMFGLQQVNDFSG